MTRYPKLGRHLLVTSQALSFWSVSGAGRGVRPLGPRPGGAVERAGCTRGRAPRGRPRRQLPRQLSSSVRRLSPLGRESFLPVCVRREKQVSPLERFGNGEHSAVGRVRGPLGGRVPTRFRHDVPRQGPEPVALVCMCPGWGWGGRAARSWRWALVSLVAVLGCSPGRPGVCWPHHPLLLAQGDGLRVFSSSLGKTASQQLDDLGRLSGSLGQPLSRPWGS